AGLAEQRPRAGPGAGRGRAAGLAIAGRLGDDVPDRAGRPRGSAGAARRGHHLAAGLRGLRGLGPGPAAGGDRGGRLVRGLRRADGRLPCGAGTALARGAPAAGRRVRHRGHLPGRPDAQLKAQPPRGGGVDSVLVSTGSDIREDTRTVPDLSHGDGDHERFAHYVDKDKIVDSAVTGTPVVALCGKVWVPSRDPRRFPVCPEGKEIYESLPEGDG